jgi:hypothetical protein
VCMQVSQVTMCDRWRTLEPRAFAAVRFLRVQVRPMPFLQLGLLHQTRQLGNCSRERDSSMGQSHDMSIVDNTPGAEGSRF